MYNRLVVLTLLTLILGFTVTGYAQGENHAPFISNIHVEQRSDIKLVDITYDVSDPDGDLLTITVAVSNDGGKTFNVNAKTFTGDVGNSIAPGKGKKITWDAGIDSPNIYSTNYVVKITANDGQYDGSAIVGQDGAPMAFIPAGEFQMGSNDGWKDEFPIMHTVYLDNFCIDVYEVTNAQYKKFMDATGYKTPAYWNDSNFNDPKQPVVGVSWNDAKAYADWAGKRLPTEAEWEKSARGRLVGKKYPWGDILTHDDANYDGRGGKNVCNPVGSFKPNGYGLYDMAGNVWEWCANWYDNDYYANANKSTPPGPSLGEWRVLRGGSWYYYFSDRVDYLRVAYRRWQPNPSGHSSDVGFRCVQ